MKTYGRIPMSDARKSGPRIIPVLYALALAGFVERCLRDCAESAIFAFDTRDSNSSHYAISAQFSFNTRAFDGLSGSRASGGFSFDTRTVTATGLTIVGHRACRRGRSRNIAS